MNNAAEIIRNTFPQKKVAVLGDLVADQFLTGTITRVSREAPVFILRHEETETLPGAAANAAANIASLGGTPILVGAVGRDANGALLIAALEKAGVHASNLIIDASVSTATKQRVVAGQQFGARQQVIRIDFENNAPLSPEIRNDLVRSFERVARDVDAVVVSDYDLGTVIPELYAKARSVCTERGIPLIVDSRHRLLEFAGATSATPNREEVEEILDGKHDIGDCETLRRHLRFEALLVTNGNQGMTLFDGSGSSQISAVGSLVPVDVTGAGDTVIAAYALGLASGMSFADAASVANHAGGIVVMKARTATVDPNELIASLGSDRSGIAKGALAE